MSDVKISALPIANNTDTLEYCGVQDSLTVQIPGAAALAQTIRDLGYIPAPINSPTFTGVPAAPTAAPGTDTTQLATTAFVHANAGTVTSVALSPPTSIIAVSGSPITGSGTLTETLQTQTANTIWAGPTSGAAAAPTFRALTSADIPGTVGFQAVIVKPSSTNRASTVAPADDPDLKFTLPTGKTFQIKVRGAFTAANNLMRLQANCAFTGTTSELWSECTFSVTSNLVQAGRSTSGAFITFVPGVVDSPNIVWAEFTTYLITTSTGVFSFQWAQGVSNVSNLTCIAGSSLTILSN